MLTYMLVRHKVKDFTAWKRGYDADLPNRIEAGLTEKHLFRGEKDMNEVITLFEARDLVLARKFAESPNLREAMEKAGVIDKPDIYFLHEEMVGVRAKAA